MTPPPETVESGAATAGWRAVALALCSGVMLALPFLHPHLFFFSWFALAPLLIAIQHARLRECWLLGVVAGLTLYAFGSYWMIDFVAMLKGYGEPLSATLASLFWIYSAQSLGLVCLLYAWLRRRLGVHDVLLFPIVFVAVQSAFPTLFPARPGDMQGAFLAAIQPIDLTGVHGLDFLIAAVNAALFNWMSPDRRQGDKQDWTGRAILSALLISWFAYGFYAQSAWSKRIGGWDTIRIGLVQPDETPSIDIPEPPAGYSRAYPPEMAVTEALVAAGAQVTIWPETRFKGYFAHPSVQRAYSNQIAALQTPLVFHDSEREHSGGAEKEYNTAVFIDAHGEPAGAYRKMKLVAFGEYLPWISHAPAIHAQLKSYLGGFLKEISPGSAPAVFEMGAFPLVPLICYETMFPAFVADAFSGRPSGRILIGLTNNGWFGATRQPYMHLYASALRAVENRAPMIHAVNNGPSAVITPDGRRFFESAFGAAGGYVVDMPYSRTSGGSFYSRHPRWFTRTIYGAFILLVLAASMRGLMSRRT